MEPKAPSEGSVFITFQGLAHFLSGGGGFLRTVQCKGANTPTLRREAEWIGRSGGNGEQDHHSSAMGYNDLEQI